MGVCLMVNLKEMSITQLKEYLSSHRNDNEAFSEALGELMSRNRGTVRYPADLPLPDMERILREKLNQPQMDADGRR
jgi:ribosomal protein L16 Arg81 hydroxylase